MLRASGRHYGTDFGLDGIVQGDGGSGVAHETKLLAFADAAIVGETNLDEARRDLVQVAGAEAMVDAATNAPVVETASLSDDSYYKSVDAFYSLRSQAMSGAATRALGGEARVAGFTMTRP